MSPWSADLEGGLHEHVITSEALRGNPLGDPHERPLWVYTPPGYGNSTRYPTIYVIQGYCGTIAMWRNRTPFRRTFPELIDALLARDDVAPALVVYVDAWTGYGGSQYLDSPAIGNYHTYLCDEVVAWVDEHYPTIAHRDSRAITGKSSGGYGAMVTAMLRPDLFGGFATHAGDALFDTSYASFFPRLARRLREEFSGSYETFLEYFRNCEVPLRHELDELLIEVYGYSAAYSSDPDGTVHVPFDPATGRLIPEVWERWLAWDPDRTSQPMEADHDRFRCRRHRRGVRVRRLPGGGDAMRIAIVGAGGVGGFFGAMLARGGADVTFIARGAHLEAMRRDGLRVEGGAHPVHLPEVRATDDPGEVGVVDLVMVCVKLWGVAAALEQIRPLVGPGTTVVSFQNGVLKDDYLAAAFGGEHVIGGVGYVATRISRPGVIEQTGSLQRLVFGEFDGRASARVTAFHEACAAGGINAEVSTDIRRETWQKFVFLVGLSATTATTRLPIGPVRENPQTRAFLLDLMREVVAVGRASGVALPDDYARECLHLVDEVAYDMTSSLFHDLDGGRPLEVPWLSGGVVELGRKAGVDTPLNRAVADILVLHADGREKG